MKKISDRREREREDAYFKRERGYKGKSPERAMKMKELIMDESGKKREQRTGQKFQSMDKFSPEDLFLMRRTSFGWIPCISSCARIY